MPTRNPSVISSSRSGPMNLPGKIGLTDDDRRLTTRAVPHSTASQIHRETAHNADVSNNRAIHRHKGVSITFQFTSGAGRCFSTGESLVSRASRGIKATLSGVNTQIETPERRVTCSSCRSNVLPSAMNDATGSRCREPASLLTAASSKCVSLSSSCPNCCAIAAPSFDRSLDGNCRKSGYRDAHSKSPWPGSAENEERSSAANPDSGDRPLSALNTNNIPKGHRGMPL